MRLLVVEDEDKTSAYLRRGLEENGFVVDVASRGDDGLHMVRSVAYDLVVLDVMLPGLDGWAVAYNPVLASPISAVTRPPRWGDSGRVAAERSMAT
jgi:DNA-binding response OmpR family regulator